MLQSVRIALVSNGLSANTITRSDKRMRWTLPNTITLSRIATLPIVVALVWPGYETRETCFWASVIYAASGVLDIVDGALARRIGQVTVMGKFLDPLADKLFYLVTLIALLQL